MLEVRNSVKVLRPRVPFLNERRGSIGGNKRLYLQAGVDATQHCMYGVYT